MKKVTINMILVCSFSVYLYIYFIVSYKKVPKRIEILTSRQQNRKRRGVISLYVRSCFFRLAIRDHVGPSQLQDFRQDFVDDEHLELL